MQSRLQTYKHIELRENQIRRKCATTKVLVQQINEKLIKQIK